MAIGFGLRGGGGGAPSLRGGGGGAPAKAMTNRVIPGVATTNGPSPSPGGPTTGGPFTTGPVTPPGRTTNTGGGFGMNGPVRTLWSSGGQVNPFQGAMNPFGSPFGGGGVGQPYGGGFGGGTVGGNPGSGGGAAGGGTGGFDIKTMMNAPPDPRLEEFNKFLKDRMQSNLGQETFDQGRVDRYAGMMNSPVQQAAAAQKAKNEAAAAIGTGGGGGGASTSAGDRRIDANAARTMAGNYNTAVKGEQDRIYDAWKNNNSFAQGMLPSYTSMGDDERARIALGLQARGQDITQMLGEGQLNLGAQNLANSQMMALMQLMMRGGGGYYGGGSYL